MIVEMITSKLLTLCSVLNEKPYIQFQRGSDISEKVANQTYKEIDSLWNQI